jgi:hypothetical protein
MPSSSSSSLSSSLKRQQQQPHFKEPLKVFSTSKIKNRALVQTQCSHVHKNLQQCYTKIWYGQPYCKKHLKNVCKLEIRCSNIKNAGNGLFASDGSHGKDDIVFKKGDKIVEYVGELISKNELDKRYAKNEMAVYTIALSKDWYIDSGWLRGAGAFCNDARKNEKHTTFKNNARFSVNTKNKTCSIKALCNIYNNEEIFCDYSNSYWSGRCLL